MGLGEVKGWLESTETQLATLSALKPDQRDAVVKVCLGSWGGMSGESV